MLSLASACYSRTKVSIICTLVFYVILKQLCALKYKAYFLYNIHE